MKRGLASSKNWRLAWVLERPPPPETPEIDQQKTEVAVPGYICIATLDSVRHVVYYVSPLLGG